jgi:hypothetical protein
VDGWKGRGTDRWWYHGLEGNAAIERRAWELWIDIADSIFGG